MSVFDDHLDSAQMRADEDKIILANYKISNSGSTLIPKTGIFSLTSQQKKLLRRGHKTEKIPAGTFKEEHSVFRSMYGNLKGEDVDKVYPVFEGILRGMNLSCLVYNRKRYYQVNREVKRQIAYQVHKEIQIK